MVQFSGLGRIAVLVRSIIAVVAICVWIGHACTAIGY
jgi:hypothetical protein